MKCMVTPPDVLTVRDRIDVEGFDWMRVIYKRIQAVVEGFNGQFSEES